MAVEKRTIGRLPVSRGTWDASTVYYKANVVSNDGSSFISLSDDPMTGAEYEPSVVLEGTNFVVYYGTTRQTGTNDKWQLLSYGRDANLSVRYVTCDSAAGSDKTLSIPGFQLTTNMRYLISMDNVNTKNNPTLNITGTGAKPIIYNGEAASATNSWVAHEVLDVYYDGTSFIMATYGGAKFLSGEKVGDVSIIDNLNSDNEHDVLSAKQGKVLDQRKADTDGYYSRMTVGAAETLVGDTIDSEAYLIRPTGGAENEVANGAASVIGMEGNSAVWNQLIVKRSKNETTQYGITFAVNDGYFSFNGTATQSAYIDYGIILLNSKLVPGHKVYVNFYGLNTPHVGMYFGNGQYFPQFDTFNKIQTVPDYAGVLSSNLTFKVIGGTTYSGGFYFQLIDLTLLGIDNLTTVADVKVWLAEHVGTKPYYAYNAGTILSAQTLGIKTYGQNLLNPTTRQAKLIPYEWEENSNVYTIKNVPSGATATFTPDVTGIAETIDISGGSLDITNYGIGILELSAATADTYVCMKWDEQKDDDVVPYEEHTQEFDVRKVYGKVNGAGEYIQCNPNGLRGIGNIKDTLTAAEAVVRIGSVDLGSLTWKIRTASNVSYFAGTFPSNAKESGICICSKYTYSSRFGKDKTINMEWWVTGFAVDVFDSNYSDAATFKTAMAGVPLYYELATPITYTDLIYRDGGIDRPLSDVLFNIEVNNWSMEEQLMTPYENGSPTSIPATIKTQYGMDAVEEIDTIKHTYVSAYSEQNFSDSQKAQARRNIGAVEEDGSYPNMSVGIAKNLAGENAVEAEYTYRPSNGTIGTNTGIANVTAVKGKTLKWNQLVQNGDFSNGTTNWSAVGGTISAANNILTYTAGSNITSTSRIQQSMTTVPGHVYYGRVVFKGSINGRIRFRTSNSTNEKIVDYLAGNKITISCLITEGTIAATSYLYIYPNNSGTMAQDDTFELYSVNFIDLTDLFGAGNEPSTVAEFEALYPLDYYAYTATPVLINNNASAIETTGFNQWDEEWENGSIDNNTGQKIAGGSVTRSKNYIKVIPNTEYNMRIDLGSQYNTPVVFFYDANYNYFTKVYATLFTTPNNAHYMMFRYNNAEYGSATYNNDICINLSDPVKNGTYEPYEKHTFYFDKVLQGEGSLATIKGKLNGEGESVVVFPDGLKSAGNVHDEIKGNVAIKRIGSVDLGTLTWTYQSSTLRFQASLSGISRINANLICAKYTPSDVNSGWETQDKVCSLYAPRDVVFAKDTSYTDAATFKTAMSGVILYYELDTPETYILDQTVTGGYQVNANGTEQRLPEDTASDINAPVSYSVIYPIDAVGTIIKLPINYISEKSLTNFTAELASKLGTFLNATIGITATYNQSTQEYDYSITITSNE